MKIIVLHGDHTTKLYERLSKFTDSAKERDWEIIYDEISRTLSLFKTERLTIIKKYSIISKKDIPNLSKIPGTLVIYNEGFIPQAFLKSLPKEIKIEEYKLPKIIWNFLDNPTIKGLHEVIKSEPVEFVFSLLAKRFRDLYWIQISPETIPYKPWQISRLKTQSKKFSLEKLQEIINKFSEIDIKVKTGRAELLLELDLLLIKSLE